MGSASYLIPRTQGHRVMRSGTRPVFWRCLIAAIGVLTALSAPAGVLDDATEPLPSAPHPAATAASSITAAERHADLLEQATTNGSVRVIVRPKMPVAPLGLSDPRHRAALPFSSAQTLENTAKRKLHFSLCVLKNPRDGVFQGPGKSRAIVGSGSAKARPTRTEGLAPALKM